MKVPGYLEKRRQGWQAVLSVPPSKRGKTVPARLRKALGTRDKGVAEARFPLAIAGLRAKLDRLLRASPSTDPVTAEAVELAASFAGLRAGDPETVRAWGGEGEIETLNDGEVVEIPAEDVARDRFRDHAAARVEAIRQAEGDARAASYAAIVRGEATPLSHHVDTWLSEPKQTGGHFPPRTRSYASIVTKLGEWLARERHPVTVQGVSRKLAGAYVTSLHNDGLSAGRVAAIVSALSSYWTWMEKRGVVPEGYANPWSRQSPGKGAKASDRDTKPREYTDDELRTLLDGPADPEVADLIRVGALSGMRIEEICNVRVRDCILDSDGKPDAINLRGTKTAAARRVVPIHSRLASIVARRVKGKPGDAFLFHELTAQKGTGERSTAIGKRFGRYRRDMGVDDPVHDSKRARSRVEFHSFRRWFITTALRANQPPHVVKQVVGHDRKGDMTTGVYHGGDTMETLRACVEAVKLPPEKRGAGAVGLTGDTGAGVRAGACE